MNLNPVVIWFALGMLAFACAGVNLMLGSYGKKKAWLPLLVASLSLGLLSLVSGYFAILSWVSAEDWSALMDVVPAMSKACGAAALVGIALNVCVLIQNLRKK